MKPLTEAQLLLRMRDGEEFVIEDDVAYDKDELEESRGAELIKRVHRDAVKSMTKTMDALDKMRGLTNGLPSTPDLKRYSSDLLNIQDAVGRAEVSLAKLKPMKG